MYSKIFVVLSFLCLPALISCNGQKGKSKTEIKTQADSVAYAIGSSIGGDMKNRGLDSLNLDILKQGMKDALHGDSVLIDPMKAQMVIQTYLQEKQKSAGEATLNEGKKFLEENRKNKDVKETATGLQYIVLQEGSGPMPTLADTIIAKYKGTLINGTEFEGGEITRHMTGLIQGWTEALLMMKVGSKWKLFVPSNLAYGDRPMGPKIPANSTLIFEMELVSIKGK